MKPRAKYKDLKAFFEKTGRTQQWLAEQLDVDQSHISLITSGQRQPSLPLAVRIRDLTGVALESLVAAKEASA